MPKKARSLKTKIKIFIYEPIPEDLETHKPQVKFSGKILSMKELEAVSFRMRRELRHFKIQEGARLKKEGESENDG